MFRGRSGMGRIVVISVLGVAILLAGCRRHHLIDVGELSVLSGFQERDKIALVDLFEREITFTERTPLTFWLSTREAISHTYRSIYVDLDTFEGITSGGEVVIVPLGLIVKVAVTIGTPKRAAGYGVLITVGGAATVALIIGVFYLFYVLLKVLFTHEH